MRTKFAAELAALSEELGRLAELASHASERAAVGLARADLTAAYEALAADEELQTGFTACENRAVILLALEAPVARDLRQVVSAIRITDDLSRIGSLISAIAETAVRYFPETIAPDEVAEQLSDIGTATAALIAATNAAIAAPPGKGDVLAPPGPALADLRAEVQARIAAPDWAHGHVVATDLGLLMHHYERCAEHCARIGGLINFFHTGTPMSLESAE
ncbi:phosphate signaling complex PhoU family protein [Nocardia macrotermitis]|uniref:phosphate signaling complex PhoU family protein n=1 Tax=Nocardia macrotermitis TaxID=2585198 RepID=UPI00188630C5|nr:PhoU domain-containing protein [Nocardia macrotermitis]